MISAKHIIGILVLVMTTLIYCGCPLLVPEIVTELHDPMLCQGWDSNGNPITVPDIVSSDKIHLCICGHLETNRDVLLQIIWVGGGDVLLTHLQVFDNGPLLNCIEEDLEPGSYRVTVLVEKTELGYVDFSVSP